MEFHSFIASEDYGTCVSSALIVQRTGEIVFTEQGFRTGGEMGDRANFSYRAQP